MNNCHHNSSVFTSNPPFDASETLESFFLFNQSPVVILNLKSNIIRANLSAEKVLGKEKIIINTPFVDFFENNRKDLIAELVKKTLAGDAHRAEAEIDCIDGQRRHFRLKFIPAWDRNQSVVGVFCSLIDLTRETSLLEMLRKSEEYYRMLANNMTDLVTLVDDTGVIEYASESHYTILGYKSEKLPSSLLSESLHPNDVAEFNRQFLKIVQQNRKISFECRVRHADGSWVWVETHARLAAEGGSSQNRYLFVSRDISERKLLEQRLSFMAFHDSLTDLPNRRLFRDRLDQAILEHNRRNQRLAVIYMDLDRFKLINDGLGHDIGDELLIAFANRIKSTLRDMDTLARFGGDEFVILLPGLQSVADAVVIVERIMAMIQPLWAVGKRRLKTTSSIGVAVYPDHAKTAVELIKEADLALYEAKRKGRNTYVLASDLID